MLKKLKISEGRLEKLKKGVKPFLNYEIKSVLRGIQVRFDDLGVQITNRLENFYAPYLSEVTSELGFFG